MKKSLSAVLALVLALSFLSFSQSVAFAGGYCPTWVKTSAKTPEAGVQNSGETFLASKFTITAGIDADATISSVTVIKKGTLNSKNISQIYITDENGKELGNSNKAPSGKSAKVKLSTPLTVKKGSTSEINISVRTKTNLGIGGGNGITVGLADFIGSINSDDEFLNGGFQNKSLYCSAYGEFKDPVLGTYHSVTQSAKEKAKTVTSGVNVAIKDFAFAPNAITIKKGTKITWTNYDGAAHTVTGDAAGGPDSDSLNSGGTYSYTFDKAGTFSYYCKFHPNMKATVTVTE
ncbi:cupredoxin family copper-binding protein [Candidatus Peregrinibacteria bacterium]|nr:cupredoxin family copper-binding protein [Candidatus Peregrinibacteria bacterium]